MNISCTQQNLQKGLTIVTRAISTHGPLPILANVMLATTKGRLRFIATNLELAISTYIGGKVDKEGSFTVPARLLQEFVATNNDPTIKLENTGGALHLKSDRYEANIKGLVADDFPLIPEVKPQQTYSLPALQLKSAIEQVVFAAATDETRPVLTGVLFKTDANQLALVATDSYRLAEKKLTLPKKVEASTSVVVPARALSELARIIEETVDMIDVIIGENQIKFNVGSSELVSRLIEGKFPDYEQIIPQKSTSQATLATQELLNSIKMASFFAREVANNIKLKLNRGSDNENTLEVSAVSPQLGDTRSKIKAEVSGEPIEIAFNAKFLGDGLAAMGTDKVSVGFSGPLSPGVLKPAGKAQDYLYIVMPLKLEE